MIRDGIKLKNNVLQRLPELIRVVKQHSHIVALFLKDILEVKCTASEKYYRLGDFGGVVQSSRC